MARHGQIIHRRLFNVHHQRMARAGLWHINCGEIGRFRDALKIDLGALLQQIRFTSFQARVRVAGFSNNFVRRSARSGPFTPANVGPQL